MNIEIAIEQIVRIKYYLSLPSTDVFWSKYTSATEVINDLELLEKGILSRDNNAISKLLLLLAPTGALQEISLSSGWADEFLVIAEAIETALGR